MGSPSSSCSLARTSSISASTSRERLRRIVGCARDEEADEPGYVYPLEDVAQGSRPDAGEHPEGDARGEADEEGGDAAPRPGAVEAACDEELGYRVVAVPDEKVVDEVDRGPRREQVEHHDQGREQNVDGPSRDAKGDRNPEHGERGDGHHPQPAGGRHLLEGVYGGDAS